MFLMSRNNLVNLDLTRGKTKVGIGVWSKRSCPMAHCSPEDPAVRGRLTECLETILNKAQEPPKSKKVQHSNAKNAVLFEAISLIIHHDR